LYIKGVTAEAIKPKQRLQSVGVDSGGRLVEP